MEKISNVKRLGVISLLRNDIKISEPEVNFYDVNVKTWNLNDYLLTQYSSLLEAANFEIVKLDYNTDVLNKGYPYQPHFDPSLLIFLMTGYYFQDEWHDTFHYLPVVRNEISKIIKINNLDAVIIITRQQVNSNTLNPISIGFAKNTFFGDFTNAWLLLKYHFVILENDKLEFYGKSEHITVEKIEKHLWNQKQKFTDSEFSEMELAVKKLMNQSMRQSLVDMGIKNNDNKI